MPDKTFIEVNRKAIEINQYNPRGQNVVPLEMHLCTDARKGECPYYVKVHINSDFISFNQGFCAYKFKKENNNK